MPAKRKSRRPTISLVGPGSLGGALALTLWDTGYTINTIAVRSGTKGMHRAKALARRIGTPVVVAGEQPLTGEVVWITVPDDAIAGVARSLAKSGDWRGKIVFHSSGALTSDEVIALRAKGARVASVHPMMTFVRGEAPDMAGVAFALEGDAVAVRAARFIVEDLGGKPFVIKKQNKVLYHAFGSFASPLVIALMAAMEHVALAAGIRKQDIKPVMAPLLQQTLRNYLERDTASAFSGPIARGDIATVRKHLSNLNDMPDAKQVYTALAHMALKSLPVRNRRSLRAELKHNRFRLK